MSYARQHLGFESESQLRAFIRALSISAVPGKFAYVGEAAALYDLHASTEEYSQVTRSVADESLLLSEVWCDELDSIRTLADIGPGNGLHAVALLQPLSSPVNWAPEEYVAVDYSSHMADLAKRNIEQLARKIRVSSVIFDLESRFARESFQLPSASESVYLLLGNTLGNVESVSRAIAGIRSLAGRGARLLVGCALLDEHRSAGSYLPPYRMNTYVNCVLHPFTMLGVPRSSMDFDVEFDATTRTINSLVRFKENFETSVLDESILIKAGSTVRCALSRRFRPGEVPSLLRQWDVSVLGAVEDLSAGHGTYCAVL